MSFARIARRPDVLWSWPVLRLRVSDAEVAVDTRFALLFASRVACFCAGRLQIAAHRGRVVAVAALPRIVLLHPRPHTLRHPRAVVFEFLLGIDGAADEVAVKVYCRADFAPQRWAH